MNSSINHTTKKVSILNQLSELSHDIKSPQVLYLLVEYAFKYALSKQDAQALFNLIKLSIEERKEESLQKKAAQILFKIDNSLQQKPLQFMIQIKALLLDIEKLKTLFELKKLIDSPQKFNQLVNTNFNFKLTEEQANVFSHIINNGTIDGNQKATLTDWFRLKEMIKEIVPFGDSFEEQFQTFFKQLVLTTIN